MSISVRPFVEKATPHAAGFTASYDTRRHDHVGSALDDTTARDLSRSDPQQGEAITLARPP